MRLLVQFESLESVSATISEFELGGLVSRVFICGEHWIEIFREISIDVPCEEPENPDQKIAEAIGELLANYSATRNLRVWVPFPVDVKTTI